MIGISGSIKEIIENIRLELEIPGDAELFREQVAPRYERCFLSLDYLCLREQGREGCTFTRQESCRYRINP